MLVYLDDIIIYTKNIPKYLKILDQLIKQLKKQNYNFFKNKFLIKLSVKYLGHIILANKIVNNLKKTKKN